MVAMHVAAARVCPGLLLFVHLLPVHGREVQGVEAHSSLGSGCVDYLAEDFNVFLSQNIKKATRGSFREDKMIKALRNWTRRDIPEKIWAIRGKPIDSTLF